MSTQGAEPTPLIELRNISKIYPDGTHAVRDVSLDIPRGKFTVFVGPSGCSKTTTVRMINRMIEPSSGTIIIKGTNVMSLEAPKLRRKIGYVMQSAGLLPHRTVQDNIATVPRLNGEKKGPARERARELMQVVGLNQDLAIRYPAQLSGGQQQRVGVARALAADPEILLMDEPFSAVDPVVRAELQEEMLRLQAELGKTVVFVTHDIDEAVKLGDQIVVMNKGRIEQVDPPERLLRIPANDFVADFIGFDRGFRHLQFYPGTLAELSEGATTRIGATAQAGWSVVLDEHGSPIGWFLGNGAETVSADSLVPGGSLFVEGNTLRSALDSALSSPANRGVAVGRDGKFRGLVSAEQILQAKNEALSH